MNATLEGRYRLLLRAYPPAYRRRHGDELLDVLLDSSPSGARWPSAGQALSLLRGGAIVDPAAVVVVASLLLPPSLAAICQALLRPQTLEGGATLTAVRLLVILTSLGFAVATARAQSRI